MRQYTLINFLKRPHAQLTNASLIRSQDRIVLMPLEIGNLLKVDNFIVFIIRVVIIVMLLLLYSNYLVQVERKRKNPAHVQHKALYSKLLYHR